MSDTDAVLGYTIDFTASDFNLVGCGEIGIEEEVNVKHQIYPNPSTDFFYIRANNFIPMDYSLTDLTGKVIRRGIYLNMSKGISIEDLNPGLYYYTISGEEGKKISGKIVVE